jgi:hypothetical protein
VRQSIDHIPHRFVLVNVHLFGFQDPHEAFCRGVVVRNPLSAVRFMIGRVSGYARLFS